MILNRNPLQDNTTNISTAVSEIVDTSNTNLLTLILINSLNIPPTSQSSATSDRKKMSPLTRVFSSLFSLKKKMIRDTFSHFGVITFVFYQNGSSFGFVNFWSSEDAKNIFNKVLSISDCIHTFRSFNFRDLGSEPVPYTRS